MNSQLKQVMLGVASALSLVFVFSSCSTLPRKFEKNQIESDLKFAQSGVLTVKGRAWIKLRSDRVNVSFPAVVLADLRDENLQKIRIEAHDPLGVTHFVLAMGSAKGLLSVDFDQRQIVEVSEFWQGLPVRELPRLVLGVAPRFDWKAVRSLDERVFASTSPNLTFESAGVEPGPRAALSRLSVKTRDSEYDVAYSSFRERGDFYLPRDVHLAAKRLSVEIAWREQQWNEPIAADVFELDARRFKGFRKVRE